ncbi:hypothetical protein [Streptomyces sp. ID05-04B]|uniref:hypothetical protein n=1 Tax=Streptomyces sp. ID05-04B TaxID=3028661 RepID=UPI0039F6AE94
MPPAFVHQITKYAPADRDEHGHYTGTEDAVSDHGPVEAAYLAAIAAFAEASGIDRLEIREPAITGFVQFGVEAPVEGHGLDGLFPPDLTGYHDRGSRRTRRSPACRRTRRNRRRTTLDALLIRMVVVPAHMHLCGRANWWLPRRLDKALPNVSLEGPGDAPAITSPPVREPQPAGRAG